MLLNFTVLQKSSLGVASSDVKTFFDIKIIVAIKCTNGTGLTTTSFTDGIRLLENPPQTDHVILNVTTSSMTQYPSRGIYHGDPTNIQFRWKVFNMYQNISSYYVSLYLDLLSFDQTVS